MDRIFAFSVVWALLFLVSIVPEVASQAIPGVHTSNWVPNVGILHAGELPLGDMWTLSCPAGATVSASVDTKDDTDNAEACLDPVLEAYDANGNFVTFGDDEFACSHAPACGYACPSVQFECGGTDAVSNPPFIPRFPPPFRPIDPTVFVPAQFSLVVRDYGAASATGFLCNKGGGYELSVSAVDADGNDIPASQLRLDGGPSRSVPAWAVATGTAAIGPALDDENVPSIFFVVPAGARSSLLSQPSK